MVLDIVVSFTLGSNLFSMSNLWGPEVFGAGPLVEMG